MGLFARDAPWLRRIFPPSVTPGGTQPLAVSEDVQLTQDYLAHGQVQLPALWNETQFTPNPGQFNFASILDLQVAGVVEPEVWRIFFGDMFGVAAPVGNYTYTVHLNHPPTGARIQIANTSVILAGSPDPVPVWPLMVHGEAVDATRMANPSPLLLAHSGRGNDGWVIQIRQTSAQAVGTFNLNTDWYVLRNQAGIAHIL